MNVHLKELLGLSLDERLQLVEDLWESIAAEMDTVPLPDSLKAELDRRLDAYLKDPARALSLEEVRRRMKGQQ